MKKLTNTGILGGIVTITIRNSAVGGRNLPKDRD